MMGFKTCKVCGSELNSVALTPFGKSVATSVHKCTETACRNKETAATMRRLWEQYGDRATHVKPFTGGHVFRFNGFQFNVHDSGKLVIIDTADNRTVISEKE